MLDKPKNAEPTGKDLITAGLWAECQTCSRVFRRLRQTARYCKHCEDGFCEGEHGSFAYGHGTCLKCGFHGRWKAEPGDK